MFCNLMKVMLAIALMVAATAQCRRCTAQSTLHGLGDGRSAFEVEVSQLGESYHWGASPEPRYHAAWMLPEAMFTEPVFRGQDEEEEEPLVTDRPDFTEASSTVGQGVLQIETGWTLTYNENETDGTITRSHTSPETLFRLGVLEFVELRLVWNYVWELTNEGGVNTLADGADDLLLGTKIGLTRQMGFFPESAVIFHVTAPTGGGPFTSHDQAEFQVNALYSWALPHDLALGASTGFSTATDVGTADFGAGPIVVRDRHNVYHQSASIGIPLAEKWGGYCEYFGFFFDGAEVDVPQHFVNSGVTYLYNNDIQFDFRVGAGLSNFSDDVFGGAGVSTRF